MPARLHLVDQCDKHGQADGSRSTGPRKRWLLRQNYRYPLLRQTTGTPTPYRQFLASCYRNPVYRETIEGSNLASKAFAHIGAAPPPAPPEIAPLPSPARSQEPSAMAAVAPHATPRRRSKERGGRWSQPSAPKAALLGPSLAGLPSSVGAPAPTTRGSGSAPEAGARPGSAPICRDVRDPRDRSLEEDIRRCPIGTSRTPAIPDRATSKSAGVN